jgi:FAD-binding domain/Ferric reductase like transmembrane component
MNHEFANEGNSPVLKVDHPRDQFSLSRATLHASNVDAKCQKDVNNVVKALPSNKIPVLKFSIEQMPVCSDEEVFADELHESNSSLTSASGFDELATETHRPTMSETCDTISVVRIQKRDSSSSFDPSSGSFYCDELEHVRSYDDRRDIASPVLRKESEPPISLRRYEPTLEDLMTIMEFDEPNAHDDSPTKETFDLIESAYVMTSAANRICVKRDIQDSSSELFPNSSLEFSKDLSSDYNTIPKRDEMTPSFNAFFGDHEPNNKKEEVQSNHKKGMEGKCSPNRPHPALEYPLLYFLLRRWSWLFEKIKIPYAYRWRLAYPLQRNVPYGTSLRKLGIYSTWGELLLLIPFFVGICFCLIYTIVFPSVSVTGKIARYGLIASFVFAQRNSLVTLAIGMPFDRGLFYHKLSGRVAGIAGVLHTAAFFIDPKYKDVHKNDFCGGAFTGSVNISGSVLMLIVIGIFISALSRIRQRVYEVFYFLHVIFSAGIITCAFFHSGILVPILGALTWGVDLYIRSIVMARTRYPQKASLKVVSDTVVEVSFPKTAAFAYNPGQYVYLAIPEISWLQWHPFSISSSPKQRVVTLHIRKVGNWTKDLFELSKKKSNVSILLEGPYGNLSIDLMNDRKYENVLVISGGIGSK